MNSEWERAARTGDAVSLAAHLSEGADVDALDRFGQSALMLAARHGHLEAVRTLVRAGADLDITGKYGLSATMLAVVNQHESVARELADAGADLRLVGSGAPGFAGRTAADLARARDLVDLAAGAHRIARLTRALRPGASPGAEVRGLWHAAEPRPGQASHRCIVATG
jgi:ankyrin repeat protein